MSKPMTIGELAARVGVSAKTVRYYEAEGVLPTPERTDSGYRRYADSDVRRLEFVRRARLLDMSVADLRSLVASADNASAEVLQAHARAMVERKLGDIDRRIAELQRLREDLTRLELRPAAAPDGPTVLACAPEVCTCARDLDGADGAKPTPTAHPRPSRGNDRP